MSSEALIKAIEDARDAANSNVRRRGLMAQEEVTYRLISGAISAFADSLIDSLKEPDHD